MDKTFIEVRSNGTISAKKGSNARTPYEHQKKAMENLDVINALPAYSTLIVLPTGGGKTYTASLWLLRHALNQHKKILWIAHRQMLLDQAAETFQKYAYSENMPNISGFQYRIVSGATDHDRTIDIKPSDQLLIASKDSLGRNLDVIKKWLKGEGEVFLIIDEAHHSTAKTYRKIIEYVSKNVPNMKLIGLTATPFRTAESEEGLLARIYKDGVSGKHAVQGDLGITYQIGLKDLINLRILSKPIFENCMTEEDFGQTLGLDDWDKIAHLDVLPESVAQQIVDNAARNKLIVETYKKNQKRYGQTIVFAVNVAHAIALSKLFQNAGISADYIVSALRDLVTGTTSSQEENEEKLEAYRKGDLQILVNVNILTEGVDLPQTQTVFLTRPTVSKTLMTQMVGRALRGVAAGGTPDAYIVSFIDGWNDHIAWVNPESLFIDSNNDFSDDTIEHQRRELQMIAISKIEEFASILDEMVDTTELERVPFEKRIPIGMYAFTYLEENGMDHSCQVMVYDSTQKAYEEMMESLSDLFRCYNVDEEYPGDDLLMEMTEQCHNSFFLGEMIPPCDDRDIANILRYYAQYEEKPNFYTFDDIDKSRLDIAVIAKKIWDEDMGARRKAEYLDELWDSTDENMLRIFFGRKLYFKKQLDIELLKLSNPEDFENEDNVRYGLKELVDLPLYEIRKIRPEYEKEIRDAVFEASKDKKGNYVCAVCGMKDKTRIPFQVDHIVPMNRGGKTVVENLQILCRSCNGTKGDR